MRFFSLFRSVMLIAMGVGAATGVTAQTKPAAFTRPYSLTAGVTGSLFNPDYIDYKLGGIGAYLDLNLYHGIGIEAEGRWLRWHTYDDIHQDNYLIGPRVKFLHIWRLQPYAKGLVGFSNMDFGPGYDGKDVYGRFTTVAFGGGVDLKVTRKWSIRPIDYEYQKYPEFLGSTLSPNGFTAGIGYKVF